MFFTPRSLSVLRNYSYGDIIDPSLATLTDFITFILQKNLQSKFCLHAKFQENGIASHSYLSPLQTRACNRQMDNAFHTYRFKPTTTRKFTCLCYFKDDRQAFVRNLVYSDSNKGFTKLSYGPLPYRQTGNGPARSFPVNGPPTARMCQNGRFASRDISCRSR